MSLISVEDALRRLLQGTPSFDRTEILHLRDAGDRVLAAPLAARLTQPPFDNSAMDGYAVRAADVGALGNRLRVIGESSAGRGFAGPVGPGDAVRIFTGAPLPQGADAVLLQEDASKLDGDMIENRFTLTAGRHVRPRGQDFLEGEEVLPAGAILDAGNLTVAAAMNHDRVAVHARPLVAIIATGDELVPVGGAPGPHQIIASSIFGVSHIARQAGAEILDLGIVADDRRDIHAAIDRARAAKADIIVTLGGASVGDYDLVQSTMVAAGMELDFWRIAMRPGKPLMVGSLGVARVLGLPGNPVSSLVCALLFLEPLVAGMARRPLRHRLTPAFTATDLPANDHRQDYLRARLRRREDGELEAICHGKQDSSQMKIFARSDGLIVRPSHSDALEAGDRCTVLALRDM
ncbi:MAG: molybdopterin molybdotransferase MoeA [Rhizobiaceae bacterium]|nr:molybdopterin molybdotransferase MoeA [Rhizobiaceae bacterium]